MRIIVKADGSPDCRGPAREGVLRQAEARVEAGDLSEDRLETLKRWIAPTRDKLDSEEFERRVEKAAAEIGKGGRASGCVHG
jgi:hypothetical protein